MFAFWLDRLLMALVSPLILDLSTNYSATHSNSYSCRLQYNPGWRGDEQFGVGVAQIADPVPGSHFEVVHVIAVGVAVGALHRLQVLEGRVLDGRRWDSAIPISYRSCIRGGMNWRFPVPPRRSL